MNKIKALYLAAAWLCSSPLLANDRLVLADCTVYDEENDVALQTRVAYEDGRLEMAVTHGYDDLYTTQSYLPTQLARYLLGDFAHAYKSVQIAYPIARSSLSLSQELQGVFAVGPAEAAIDLVFTTRGGETIRRQVPASALALESYAILPSTSREERRVLGNAVELAFRQRPQPATVSFGYALVNSNRYGNTSTCVSDVWAVTNK